MIRYPIYIHKADDGTYSGFVPDVEGCYFSGDTIDDAIAQAEAALDVYFTHVSPKGILPPESKPVDAYVNDEDCQGGYWAFASIDESRYNDKSVKLNITLPQSLLTRIDNYVAAAPGSLSRSGFIAELARQALK